MVLVGDVYLCDWLYDFDDLLNWLLCILIGQGKEIGVEMLDNFIFVVCNIGLGELLEYGKVFKGIVLEEGFVGSYVVIVVCVWVILLVIYVFGIMIEVLNGDLILVDGEQGVVYLWFDDNVKMVFCDKIVMYNCVQECYVLICDLLVKVKCGIEVVFYMNVGLMVDLLFLLIFGVEGVGLFWIEL